MMACTVADNGLKKIICDCVCENVLWKTMNMPFAWRIPPFNELCVFFKVASGLSYTHLRGKKQAFIPPGKLKGKCQNWWYAHCFICLRMCVQGTLNFTD